MGTLEEFLTQPTEGFKVHDLSTADWALRKIAHAQGKIQEIHNFLLAEIAKLEAWEAQAMREHERTIDFMEAALAPYIASEIADGRKKSIRLPHGVAGYRVQAPAWKKDEDALLAWARPMGFIKVKEEVNWEYLRKSCRQVGDKLISPDGEVVPGVVMEERPPSFFVRIEEES